MKNIVIVVMMLSLSGWIARSAEGESKPKPAPAAPAPTSPAPPTAPKSRPNPPLAEGLKQFDLNGDGKLDAQERVAATKARHAEAIKKYDKNGDGTLDAEEAKAMNEARRKEREEAIAKYKAEREKKKEETK
jgi:hypothetical protein